MRNVIESKNGKLFQQISIGFHNRTNAEEVEMVWSCYKSQQSFYSHLQAITLRKTGDRQRKK